MTENEPLTKDVRVRRDGRITIPAEFRRALGIGSETLLLLTGGPGEMLITPVQTAGLESESDWLAALQKAFAPIRAERLARGESAEDIDANLGEAIAQLRVEHAAAQAGRSSSTPLGPRRSPT